MDALKDEFKARSGIIPFVVLNDNVYLLLAQDKKTSEFSDFGGGQKRGESVIQNATREFEEESSDIFPKIDGIIADTSTVVVNTAMALIFLPVPLEWTVKSDCFEPNEEVSGLRWFSEEEFGQMLKSGLSKKVLWSKIQEHLKDTAWNSMTTLLKSEWKHHYSK